MRNTKYLAAALLCTIAAGAPGTDGTNNFPLRSVRLIAPFAPSGGADVDSRLVAQKLTKAWGQQVIIDNCVVSRYSVQSLTLLRGSSS